MCFNLSLWHNLKYESIDIAESCKGDRFGKGGESGKNHLVKEEAKNK